MMPTKIFERVDAYRPSMLVQYLLAAVALLGFALVINLFYPGLTSPDSDYQFSQARNFEFADGHPPIMALVWSLMIKLKDGPALMMLLFAVTYWTSFWIIARTLSHRSTIAAVILYCFALSPLLLNYAGTIWKDVFVFNFFILAFALLFAQMERGKPIGRARFFVVAVVIIIGSLGRHNSIFSGLPLMVLTLFARNPDSARNLSDFVKIFAKGSVVYIGLLIPAYLLVQYIAQPTPMSVSSSLFVFDLIGISLRANEYLLPVSKTFKLAQLQACYEPAGWDKVWVSCPALLDEMRADGSWSNLSRYWLSAIESHPMDYVMHRIGHFKALFVPTWLVFLNDSTPLAAQFGFKKGAAFMLFERLMMALRNNAVLGILLTNGFWIVVNTTLMGWSTYRLRIELNKHNIVIFLLAMSGFVYSAPFLLIGTAPDFRYVYWSIGSTVLAATLQLAIIFPNSIGARRRKR